MVTFLLSSIKSHESKFSSKAKIGKSLGVMKGENTTVKCKYFAIRCPKLPDGLPDENYWKEFPEKLKRFSGETTL